MQTEHYFKSCYGKINLIYDNKGHNGGSQIRDSPAGEFWSSLGTVSVKSVLTLGP